MSPAQYLFHSHEKHSEYERLCLIQQSFDEKTRQHLLRAGLKEGMDCLEVGLGAGSIAVWMQKEIGTSGSLLGVDLNTDYSAEHGELQSLEGDILELEFTQEFDLIHLRYLLIHNKHSSAILSKLYRLLKPGGKIIVEEPDFTLAKWMDANEIEACKRVNSAICRTFEARGLKPHYGSVSHLSMEEAGFEIEESKSYLHLCSGDESVARLMALSAEALEDEYLQTGLCSKADLEAYKQACRDKDSLGVYYATVALIGVKKEGNNEAVPEAVKSEEKPSKENGFYMLEKENEIEEAYEVMKELRAHLDPDSFLSQLRLQMKEGYVLIGRYEQSRLVALAGCRVALNLAWGKHLYVDDLVTAGKERSKGYGKEMMEYLVLYGREKGCKELHLDSGVQRFGAHKFYMGENMRISSHHFVMGL